MATASTIKKERIRDDAVTLKLRVDEVILFSYLIYSESNFLFIFYLKLEKEINQYKKKLEDLRKAKNILIMKKSTEFVNVRDPSLG